MINDNYFNRLRIMEPIIGQPLDVHTERYYVLFWCTSGLDGDGYVLQTEPEDEFVDLAVPSYAMDECKIDYSEREVRTRGLYIFECHPELRGRPWDPEHWLVADRITEAPLVHSAAMPLSAFKTMPPTPEKMQGLPLNLLDELKFNGSLLGWSHIAETDDRHMYHLTIDIDVKDLRIIERFDLKVFKRVEIESLFNTPLIAGVNPTWMAASTGGRVVIGLETDFGIRLLNESIPLAVRVTYKVERK